MLFENIYCSRIIQFSQCDFRLTFQFLIILGRGYELFTVVRICNVVELGHHMVWLYIHGYECFGGAFWFCPHRPSDDGSGRCRPNRLCWPFKLHVPISEKTTISNLNIMHLSCIVSLCYKYLCTHARQYRALLFYIILVSEQQCVAGNIITNIMVYCVMNVHSCSVMGLKL